MTHWMKMKTCGVFGLGLAIVSCSGDTPTKPTELPPIAPAGLAATAASRQVSLNWGAVSGATSYKVLRGGAEIASVSATTYTDVGLTNKTQYCYTVRAVGSGGASPDSNQACAAPRPDFTGNWSGTTSQGRTITFLVQSGRVNGLSATVQATGGPCTVTTTLSGLSGAITDDDMFQIVEPTGSSRMTVKGTFGTETSASGSATLEVTSGLCAGASGTATWTANKS